MNYLTLIRAIKAAPDGFYLGSLHGKAYEIINHLYRIGCIDLNYSDKGMIATIAPKPTPSQSELIHISHWRSGKRKDAFSQQAYKVVSREGEWVKYELQEGVVHTVKVQYTKAAA